LAIIFGLNAGKKLDENSQNLAVLHEPKIPRNMYHTTKDNKVYTYALLEEVLCLQTINLPHCHLLADKLAVRGGFT
jgi:hypothetical protein